MKCDSSDGMPLALLLYWEWWTPPQPPRCCLWSHSCPRGCCTECGSTHARPIPSSCSRLSKPDVSDDACAGGGSAPAEAGRQAHPPHQGAGHLHQRPHRRPVQAGLLPVLDDSFGDGACRSGGRRHQPCPGASEVSERLMTPLRRRAAWSHDDTMSCPPACKLAGGAASTQRLLAWQHMGLRKGLPAFRSGSSFLASGLECAAATSPAA